MKASRRLAAVPENSCACAVACGAFAAAGIGGMAGSAAANWATASDSGANVAEGCSVVSAGAAARAVGAPPSASGPGVSPRAMANAVAPMSPPVSRSVMVFARAPISPAGPPQIAPPAMRAVSEIASPVSSR
ncbi:MAG: hypothetical protein ACMVO3_03620 [Thalassobaculum sp.]